MDHTPPHDLVRGETLDGRDCLPCEDSSRAKGKRKNIPGKGIFSRLTSTVYPHFFSRLPSTVFPPLGDRPVAPA